jgi:hypothetical protein
VATYIDPDFNIAMRYLREPKNEPVEIGRGRAQIFQIFQITLTSAKLRGGDIMKLEIKTIQLPACGLDVHKDVIEACVFDADGNGVLKTFSTMRSALFALRDWLLSLKCFHVLMESTSVYWIPIYEILESVSGMDVGVGNARHMKNFPGRAKTDKSDAAWIAKLSAIGHILKSFVVGRKFRELREYTRYHKKQVEERARHINRIEKLLQMSGFKLSSVLSDITGVSALRLLKKLRDNGNDRAREAVRVDNQHHRQHTGNWAAVRNLHPGRNRRRPVVLSFGETFHGLLKRAGGTFKASRRKTTRARAS